MQRSDSATRISMNKPTLQPSSSDPDEVKCKYCGSSLVRPSVKSSGKNSRITYRCQSCKKHFRVSSGWLDQHRALAGGVLSAIVLAGAAVMMLLDKPSDTPLEAVSTPENKDIQTRLLQEAKQGRPESQYTLGRNYWVNAEYQQAFPWLKAAAEQRHVEAEFLLGTAYLNGLGTLQNYRLALDFFTRSAEQGHLEAEFRLGMLYRDGLAMPPDKESAYIWLNIAAARGHPDALQLRDKLAAVMTTEELNRAQEASTHMHAKVSGADIVKP
jgi:uncharacterized protein